MTTTEYQLSQREADELTLAQAAIDRGMPTGWLRHDTTLSRLTGVGSWVENPSGYVQAYPAGMEPISRHHATQWSGDREVYTWHPVTA
jgi:hypothetical protein